MKKNNKITILMIRKKNALKSPYCKANISQVHISGS